MTSQPALALTWEEHTWRPRHPVSPMSRTAQRRVGTPYRAAVPAAIADLPLTLDPYVIAEAEDARAEVTRFDAELSTLFAGDAEFAPLTSVLLRTESASSSQIEDITAGSNALAMAELGLSKANSNATKIVANVDAMQHALALAENVTPQGLLDIHEALMRGQSHADPGTFRDQQVWIGGGMQGYPHGATFIPPHHDRVTAALDDLCRFITRTDLPLLAHAAIAHAQFETIHPFIDGNGRTGRALVHAMLKAGKATTRTTVPVSAGLLTDTRSYFDALTAYRAGDPDPIVTAFSHAALRATNNGRALAADLSTIHADWQDRLTARRDSVAWRILPMLLSQPALTSKVVQDRTGASHPAVDRALRQLLDAGIVKAKSAHGPKSRRDTVWSADAVTDALDAFAERARRNRY